VNFTTGLAFSWLFLNSFAAYGGRPQELLSDHSLYFTSDQTRSRSASSLQTRFADHMQCITVKSLWNFEHIIDKLKLR